VSDQNKQLMHRAVDEIWNQERYELLPKFVASDFVIHTPHGDVHGRAGAAQYFTMLHQAFPDIHFTIEDQVADGDRVVTRWTATGTHQGAFQGIAPTNRRIKMTGTDIDRIASGMVIECWTTTDDLGLLQQLGAIESTAPVAVERD
jgi:predicted ester cyclase